VDVMLPSDLKNAKQFSSDDYTAHGQIIKEMRAVARNYGIPVVTITQNNRMAENFQAEMNNNLIGDSIKKIRYSDTIIMIRQRQDIDLFSSQVTADINISNSLDNSQDFLKYLIPFEMKITKAKDGLKNSSKFHIFNTQNLRIYQNFDDVVSDNKLCSEKSEKIKSELSVLGVPEHTEIDFDQNDPFSNLIV
jgi:hypothetical protein